MACPCGKGATIEECCGRFFAGAELPATAQELMRSRYSAYASGRLDYIEATHDPETRTSLRPAELRWVKLEVLDCEEGGPGDQQGWVEFRAHYRVGTQNGQLHERSYFRRWQGRWVYTSGTAPEPTPQRRAEVRVGRNEPCACGSGKKHKHCCLKNAV